MSASNLSRPILPPAITALKGIRPIVVLTAYFTPMARHVDRHCDMVLVGDSLGMVIHGLPSTHSVTLEMMIMHGRAVVRGTEKAPVVIDMPFGSYEESPEQAFHNASRVISETGATAVKLEGGGPHMVDTVAFLNARGIPVVAHIGLTPQALHTLGGYRVVGRGDEAEVLKMSAQALQAAGAFALVMEQVPAVLAAEITRGLAIPTIGIGSGPGCDGQVLVTEDILGLFTEFKPKFVKRYAELDGAIGQAIASFADEVRAGRFPTAEHAFADHPDGTGGK